MLNPQRTPACNYAGSLPPRTMRVGLVPIFGAPHVAFQKSKVKSQAAGTFRTHSQAGKFFSQDIRITSLDTVVGPTFGYFWSKYTATLQVLLSHPASNKNRDVIG